MANSWQLQTRAAATRLVVVLMISSLAFAPGCVLLVPPVLGGSIGTGVGVSIGTAIRDKKRANLQHSYRGDAPAAAAPTIGGLIGAGIGVFVGLLADVVIFSNIKTGD
jgi:hypothetical protein